MLLPHIPLHTKNEFINGRPRWKYVVSATKALIGASDPHLRWLILRAGIDEFIRVAREKFANHEPAIRFTEDELRWMFAILPYSLPLRFREAMQAAEIAKYQRKPMTDKMLKGSGGEGPTGHDGPTTEYGGGIVVESLPDRDKSTVH